MSNRNVYIGIPGFENIKALLNFADYCAIGPLYAIASMWGIYRAQVTYNFKPLYDSLGDVQGSDTQRQIAKAMSNDPAIRKFHAVMAIIQTLFALTTEFKLLAQDGYSEFLIEKIYQLSRTSSEEGKLPPGRILKQSVINSENVGSHQRGLINSFRGLLQTACIYSYEKVFSGFAVNVVSSENAATIVAKHIMDLGFTRFFMRKGLNGRLG